MALKLCSDVSPSNWITDGVDSWNSTALFGPPEFEAHARLRFMPDPAFKGQRASDVRYDPTTQTDESLVEQRLCGLLATVTRTPEDCFFALWDGHGDLEPLRGGPQMRIPNRAYYLFHGPLSDVGNWETAQGVVDWWPAAFIWPADHAWCVASDTDPHWAGIGASSDTILMLLEQQHLDVVAAERRLGGPFYM